MAFSDSLGMPLNPQTNLYLNIVVTNFTPLLRGLYNT